MNLKNPFFLVGFSEFFSKALSWLTLALIPLFASPEIYGQIVLYYSLIIFLIPIYLFGQDRLILKNQPEYEVLNSLIFTFLIWILLSFIFFYLNYFWASVASFALTLNKLYLTYLRSKDYLRQYAINRLIYSIIRLILVIYCIYFFYSLTNYILAEFFSAIIVSFGIFTLLFKSKIRINLSYKNRIMHGFPLMLHGISIFGVTLADRFILERYTNLTDVGNYSFIYIFASGLVFLYSIVSIIQEKKIYKSINNIDLIKNIKITIKLMFAIGVAGSILSIILYIVLIKFNIVRGYNFYPYELIILLLSYLILPVYLVSNYFLIQRGKGKLLVFSSLTSFIVNIILNFLLIPTYGLQGAVYATLLANILLCILIFLISFRLYKSTSEHGENI